MTNPVAASVDTAALGRTSTAVFIDVIETRDPGPSDVNYPVQKKWLNLNSGSFWELANFSSLGGYLTANWIQIASGASPSETLTGNSGGPVIPFSNNINVFGDVETILTSGSGDTLTISTGGTVATTYIEDGPSLAVPAAGNLNILGGTGVTTVGSGSTITIMVDANVPTVFHANLGNATPALNAISILGTGTISTTGAGSTITISASDTAPVYTALTSPTLYDVTDADYYISVDTSAGATLLVFPNNPTHLQQWVVKDRTGHASAAGNHIGFSTLGGLRTFDGQTTYTIDADFQAVNILANPAGNYEIY